MSALSEKKEYILPEDVSGDFRRILGLKEEEEIPLEAISAYRYFKFAKDVCTAGKVSTSELIVLTMLAKITKRDKIKGEITNV